MIRRPRITSASHLAFIRTLPCVVTRQHDVEAAHIRFSDLMYGKRLTGMMERPDDKWTVPLSTSAHRDQHKMNERDWWMMRGINPLIIAALLFAHSGDDEAATSIIMNARVIAPW